MNAAFSHVRLRGLAAIAVVGLTLAIGVASASAANPSVLNTDAGCVNDSGNQTQWLISCAVVGEDSNHGTLSDTGHIVNHPYHIWLGALVSRDQNTSLSMSNILLDEWSNSEVSQGTSCSRPTIGVGYPRSRCDWDFDINTTGTGMGCSGSNARWQTDRVLGIKFKDSSAQTSAISNSLMTFVADGHCSGQTEAAEIYDWEGLSSGSSDTGCTVVSGSDNFSNNITPNTTLRFCYKGDSPGGSEEFNGVLWRLRNIETGAIVGGSGSAYTSCPGNLDNGQKSLAVTFSARGAWVVEANALRALSDNATNCSNNAHSKFWFPIGFANVNSSGAPSANLTLSTNRPQLNGSLTATASGFTDPDSADGGGVQVIEWDLNDDSTYEADSIAGEKATFSTNQSKAVDTSGMSAGTHTVRIRVMDNGAIDAADPDRKESAAGAITQDFTVDSPPTLTAPTNVSGDAATTIPISLSATDANGDTRTYSVASGQAHGTGSFSSTTGSTTTYNYSPTSSYAGTDSITFKVDDGFGGTDTKTVTINVKPTVSFTGSTPTQFGTVLTGSVTAEFSSQTGVTFKCSLDGATATTCSSGQSFSGLATGTHAITVTGTSATGSLTGSAERDFVVDASGRTCTVTGTTGGTVSGTGAADVVCVALGNYTVNAGDGDDVVFAGPGNDTLNGENGNDALYGGAGTDTLNGGSDSGNDRLDGGTGADMLNGGDGIDRVLYDSRTAAVSATIGGGAVSGETGENDTIASDVESITGGAGNDTLLGDSGNNTLSGHDGNDVISGGAGTDFMGGGVGSDSMSGASGVDRVTYSDYTSSQPVSVTLDNVANDGNAESDNVHSDVEYVYGGAGNDTLDGSMVNTGVGFSGGAGDDTLTGGSGDDALFGGLGDDTLSGNVGTDIVKGGTGADQLNCGDGSDTYGNDTSGADTVNADCEISDTDSNSLPRNYP